MNDLASKHDIWRKIEDNAYLVKYDTNSIERGMTLTGINQALNEVPVYDPPSGWISCQDELPKDGVYIVYAPSYRGGSSSAKENHNGIMFSSIKNGKWSVEHGYYKRPGCVVAWMGLPKPYEGK